MSSVNFVVLGKVVQFVKSTDDDKLNGDKRFEWGEAFLETLSNYDTARIQSSGKFHFSQA